MPSRKRSQKNRSGRSRGVIRDPLKYKTELCEKWIKMGECPYTYKCQFAHGESDLRTVKNMSTRIKIIKPPSRPPPGFEQSDMKRSTSNLSSKEWIPPTYIYTRTLQYQNNMQDDEDYEQYWDLIQSIVQLGQYAK